MRTGACGCGDKIGNLQEYIHKNMNCKSMSKSNSLQTVTNRRVNNIYIYIIILSKAFLYLCRG